MRRFLAGIACGRDRRGIEEACRPPWWSPFGSNPEPIPKRSTPEQTRSVGSVLPARAGMVPGSAVHAQAPDRASRASGDGPELTHGHPAQAPCFPRERGWSRLRPAPGAAGSSRASGGGQHFRPAALSVHLWCDLPIRIASLRSSPIQAPRAIAPIAPLRTGTRRGDERPPARWR